VPAGFQRPPQRLWTPLTFPRTPLDGSVEVALTCGEVTALDYSIFKDFAGPVATIIAALDSILKTFTWEVGTVIAVLAVGVPGYFAWRQSRTAAKQLLTAEKQSRTAEEKLRLDLFDKRHAVYEELRAIVGRYGGGRLTQLDCVKFKEVSSNAAFLFDTDVTSFLDSTHQDLCQEVVQWAAPRPISEDRREAVEAELVARANRLSSIYKDLDERVSRYMTHHQKA
jgi:hypothetical protein